MLSTIILHVLSTSKKWVIFSYESNEAIKFRISGLSKTVIPRGIPGVPKFWTQETFVSRISVIRTRFPRSASTRFLFEITSVKVSDSGIFYELDQIIEWSEKRNSSSLWVVFIKSKTSLTNNLLHLLFCTCSLLRVSVCFAAHTLLPCASTIAA